MPVQIGARSHKFTDPTGLLSDCHRRIEMFLGALAAVADKAGAPPSEETALALETALRYFNQAAPKHTADEEESVFPRLRKISHPDLPSAFSMLDQLEKDHEVASKLHPAVERLGRAYLAAGHLSSSESEQFRAAVKSLQRIYAEHIRIEDHSIFPLAARLLSDDEKSAIAREMAERRNGR